MLLNDATFLLDESLAKLTEIRATQQLLANPQQWQAYVSFLSFSFSFSFFVFIKYALIHFFSLTPDQQRERNETHVRAERMVSSCILSPHSFLLFILLFCYYFIYIYIIVDLE